MKYRACPSIGSNVILALLLPQLLGVLDIIFCCLFDAFSDPYGIAGFIVVIISSIALLFAVIHYWKHLYSFIYFNDVNIECKFCMHVWKSISYCDVKHWGTFICGQKERKIIYFSKADGVPERSDNFYWFAKQKDIIVMEYRYDIIDNIRHKLPHAEFIEVEKIHHYNGYFNN